MAHSVRCPGTMQRRISQLAITNIRSHAPSRAELLAFLGCAIGAIALWNRPLDPAMWFGVLMFGEMLQVTLPLDRATLSMSSCFECAALCCLPTHEAVLVTA